MTMGKKFKSRILLKKRKQTRTRWGRSGIRDETLQQIVLLQFIRGHDNRLHMRIPSPPTRKGSTQPMMSAGTMLCGVDEWWFVAHMWSFVITHTWASNCDPRRESATAPQQLEQQRFEQLERNACVIESKDATRERGNCEEVRESDKERLRDNERKNERKQGTSSERKIDREIDRLIDSSIQYSR